jgi:D-3-phosphoglycerate dehydrogenase / 2-oxoglutarate reductase
MARIWNGPIKRAIVVEHPALELDTYLQNQDMIIHRMAHIPAEEELIKTINEHKSQVIFKRSKVEVTRQLIESCPSLLAVQLCCIGDDSVDKSACADHGIMIFNDPISNGRSVVEMVVGNLIALSRRFYETNQSCRTGVWEKTQHERYEIQGKHLGILGLGNIGRTVARSLSNLGMKIHFYDTRQVSIELGKEMGWTHHESIESLFRSSECVTVHFSARDVNGHSNQGIINAEHFSLLGADRPEGMRIFINFGRGFIHSPEDLIEATNKGYVKRAAVDVYPHEPRKGSGWLNPYQNCEKVAVFPHIGASTKEAQPRIAARVSETFGQFSKSGAVRDTPYQTRTELNLSNTGRSGTAFLMVCHSTARGTKRAIDEAIYEAGVSNLSSVHTDFDEYRMAYDLALIDRPLSSEQLQMLIQRADDLTQQTNAIRSVRQVIVD